MRRLAPTLCVVSLFPLAPLLASAQEVKLAERAKSLLAQHCYRCHGQDGANEGGLNFVLLRDKMVAGGRHVVPGDPEKSLVYKRLADKSMPPEGEPRPTVPDIETIKAWIAAGAPDTALAPAARKRIDLTDMLSIIKDDLDKAPKLEQKSLRYFTITHLYNAGVSEDELQSYRHGLSKLVNNLSWGPTIVIPKAIDPARTVMRVDLRDYQWTEKTWNEIISSYPYGVLLDHGEGNSVGKFCCDSTKSRLPMVRADWFLAAASVPPLYESILNLPPTDRALEKILGVTVEENIKLARAARAAFNGSAISKNNRLIERHTSSHGAYWKSYDFAESSDDKANLFVNPIGPAFGPPPDPLRPTADLAKDPKNFKHGGGEILFSLPNGLHAFMIVNALGERRSTAPATIVGDPRRPDRLLVNGLACMSCHNQGVLPKDDQLREFIKVNPAKFQLAEVEVIKSLYPKREEFAKLQTGDNEKYQAALAKIGGRVSKTEPVFALAQRFEAPLDLAAAAAELDHEAADFVRTVNKAPNLSLIFEDLRIKERGKGDATGGTIKRKAFADIFYWVAYELNLATIKSAAETPKILADAPGAVATVKLNTTLSDLILSRDRQWLYILSNREVRRLNTQTLQMDDTSVKVSDGTEQMRMSPNGKFLYTCAAPKGHDPYNAKMGGIIQVIDTATFRLRSTIPVPFSPWDIAVCDEELIYVSNGGGQSVNLPIIDAKKEVVLPGRASVWHRSLLRLTPDQKRLYLSISDLFPNRIDGFPITSDMKSDRNTNSQFSGAGGRYEILPDGKWLLTTSGQMFRLSHNREDDLKPVPGRFGFLALAANDGASRLFYSTEAKTVNAVSYPEFRNRGSFNIGELVYRMAYDDKSGKLYCACSRRDLFDRLQIGIGDLKIIDVNFVFHK